MKRAYVVIYECGAPEKEVLDSEWENIPDEHKKIINEQGGLPCDGGGVPGDWCLCVSKGFGKCRYLKGVEKYDGDPDDILE